MKPGIVRIIIIVAAAVIISCIFGFGVFFLVRKLRGT